MLRIAVQRDEEGRFVKVNLEISQRLIVIQIGVLRGAFSGKEARGSVVAPGSLLPDTVSLAHP